MLGTAEHIRHAVAIDERHCKFKPALMQQDINANEDIREDIKEVYFPGTHGDVGGGWLAEGDQNAHGSNDPVQLSDIALEWMIIQIQELPTKEAEGRLGFNKHADMFLANTFKKKEDACTAKMHDVLSFNGGESGMMVAFWNFLGKSLRSKFYSLFLPTIFFLATDFVLTIPDWQSGYQSSSVSN